MGCDIHLYIEKKIKGKWIPAQGFMQTSDEERSVPDVPFNDRFNDRDYLLFGFLAGVRDSTNQHFEPKGFPDDASKEVKRVYEGWEGASHTPSYLTLAELKSVDWDHEMIKIDRLFLKKQLKAFNESVAKGKPNYNLIDTWCGGTNDMKNWVHAEIERPIRFEFRRFYDLVFWLNSYDYRCKEDEIRIVFWFDN
jgi:hypothetical protein